MPLLRRALRALVPVAAGVGLLAAGAPARAAAPPAAPTGLSATYASGAVTLAWTDASADETGFVIERCIASTSCGRIAGVGAGVTSFVDTWYGTGSNDYRVRAVNASGASAPSNVASAGLVGFGEVSPRLVAIGATTGPAPLAITFDGSASTALNGTVTAWDWSFGDDTFASATAVSHTFTTPGTYVVRLRATATTVFGSGTTSDAASVLVTVTAPPLPLAAPSDLAAVSPARGQIHLTWTNPATSATSLVLQRCTGRTRTAFAPVATVTGTTTYADTVKRSTTYRYRLVATGAAGTAASNVVTVTSK